MDDPVYFPIAPSQRRGRLMLTLEPGGHRAVDKMLCSPLPQNSALWQEEGSPLPTPSASQPFPPDCLITSVRYSALPWLLLLLKINSFVA